VEAPAGRGKGAGGRELGSRRGAGVRHSCCRAGPQADVVLNG
jgi:hypothetical protein